MKKLLHNKFIIPGTIMMLLVIVLIYSYMSWEYCIETRQCVNREVNNIYRPSYYASLSLLTFFTFFLFLPFRYFKNWLIWVFSWGIIFSIVLVRDNLNGMGSFPIYDRETIILLTGFFWTITIFFCLFLWWWGRRK